MAYDVSISSLVPPKFPERCVLCGAEEPGKQVRFSAGAKYGAFFFVAWFGKGKGSIVAPACGTCAISAMSFSLARFAVSAALAAAAAWLLFAGMKGGRGLFKLKAVAVFFAAVVPAVVWDWLFPARFSVTFDGENHQAICHFSNPQYAAQFDTLNHFDTLNAPASPDGMEEGATQPFELPANFNPSAASNKSRPSASTFSAAESYEDKTNPYRNLEDPRFKK